MKNKPSIVFVTAHPDDVAFSMGGTAALLKEEYSLHVICLSSGERGVPWDGKGLPPQSPEMGAQREKEELDSAEVIGADVLFFHEPDGEIFAHQAVCRRVADDLHDASYWDKLLEENRAMGTLAVHCEYAEAWLSELPNVTRRWTRTARSVLTNDSF